MKFLQKLSMIVILLLAGMTAQASPLANWATPTNLCDWRDIDGYSLEMGTDGTQAIFWAEDGLQTMSMWARLRPPGQDWGAATNVSGWLPSNGGRIRYGGVSPDGTAWAMWAAIDNSLVGDNLIIQAAHRPPDGNWQIETLSAWPAAGICGLEVAMSPEGGLLVVWIECAGSQYAIYSSMHPAGAPGWSPPMRIDDAWGNTTISQIHPLAGPGESAAVLWVETNPLNASEEGVMARTYDPQSGNWISQYAPPISGWQSNTSASIYQTQPVMRANGTIVAAWLAWNDVSSKRELFSTTLPAASSVWSNPQRISSAEPYSVGPGTLNIGEDGTVVAAWICRSASGTDFAVCANVRDPGSSWGMETNLSGWQTNIRNMDVGIWPNGEALVAWAERDGSRPADSDTRLYWSLRPPWGAWGDGGQGQLGEWIKDISGLALGLGHDHSAVLAWGVEDANRPVDPSSVSAATWLPGGAWDAPATISDWYLYTNLYARGLVVGSDGQSVAAAWIVSRSTSPPTAIFYNEMMGGPGADGDRIYLPLVRR